MEPVLLLAVVLASFVLVLAGSVALALRRLQRRGGARADRIVSASEATAAVVVDLTLCRRLAGTLESADARMAIARSAGELPTTRERAAIAASRDYLAVQDESERVLHDQSLSPEARAEARALCQRAAAGFYTARAWTSQFHLERQRALDLAELVRRMCPPSRPRRAVGDDDTTSSNRTN